MGRELRRKQAKKEGKDLQKENIKEEKYIKNLFKITGILVFIICVIYILSALFVTKELDWFKEKDTTTNENTVANQILASQIFKQSEEEYYVYFYDFNEKESSITTTVTNKLTDKKVYKVDTKSALNSKYISDTSNKQAKNLEELKVKAPTLIKIVADQITEYYENDEIENKLK